MLSQCSACYILINAISPVFMNQETNLDEDSKQRALATTTMIIAPPTPHTTPAMIATLSEFGDLVDNLIDDVVGVGEPLSVEYEVEAVVVCIVVVGGGVTEKVNSTKEQIIFHNLPHTDFAAIQPTLLQTVFADFTWIFRVLHSIVLWLGRD
jgi:hypothetical protein